jgi:hypothetical protein
VSGWGGLSGLSIPSLASIRGGGPPSRPTAGGGSSRAGAGGREVGAEGDISEGEGEVVSAGEAPPDRKKVRYGKHRDKRKDRRRSR